MSLTCACTCTCVLWLHVSLYTYEDTYMYVMRVHVSWFFSGRFSPQKSISKRPWTWKCIWNVRRSKSSLCTSKWCLYRVLWPENIWPKKSQTLIGDVHVLCIYLCIQVCMYDDIMYVCTSPHAYFDPRWVLERLKKNKRKHACHSLVYPNCWTNPFLLLYTPCFDIVYCVP